MESSFLVERTMHDERTRRLLVMGSTGKVGKLLKYNRYLEAELGKSWKVIYVSRRAGADIRWAPGDDRAQLGRADAILGLWGRVRGTEAELADNSALADEADRIAQATGARRVFHCSTAAVYVPGAFPAEEGRLCDPGSAYGRAKYTMEQEILRFHGAEHVVLRLANVVGADALFTNISAGRDIVLDQFEDGSCPFRSYITPRDFARVVAHLLTMPKVPRLLNVTGEAPVAMAEILDCLDLPFSWKSAPAGALPMVALSAERLAETGAKTLESSTAQAIAQALAALAGEGSR